MAQVTQVHPRNLKMPKKKKSARRGHNKQSIESEHYEVIEFTCPIRGKITQKVKVTRLKSKLVDPKQYIGGTDELDTIDSSEDELEAED